MRSVIWISGTALVFGCAVTAQSAAFIDDFSVGQAVSTDYAASGFDAGSSLATSYGSRALFGDIISNDSPGDTRVRTAIEHGTLTFSSDTGVTGKGFVSYSFTTPLDLSTTPALTFTILSNDLTGTILLEAIDSANHFNQFSVTLPPVAPSGPPLILTIPAAFTGVDLSHITKLEFAFGGTDSEDLRVDSIAATAVPEPTVAGLALIAGSALLRRRRRV